jgi:hypothetical protein
LNTFEDSIFFPHNVLLFEIFILENFIFYKIIIISFEVGMVGRNVFFFLAKSQLDDLFFQKMKKKHETFVIFMDLFRQF